MYHCLWGQEAWTPPSLEVAAEKGALPGSRGLESPPRCLAGPPWTLSQDMALWGLRGTREKKEKKGRQGHARGAKMVRKAAPSGERGPGQDCTALCGRSCLRKPPGPAGGSGMGDCPRQWARYCYKHCSCLQSDSPGPCLERAPPGQAAGALVWTGRSMGSLRVSASPLAYGPCLAGGCRLQNWNC